MKKLSIFNVLIILSFFLTVRLVPYLSEKLLIPEFFLTAFVFSLISLIISLLMAPIIKRHLARYRKTKKQSKFYIGLGVVMYLFALAIANRLTTNFPLIITGELIDQGLGYISLFFLAYIFVLTHILILIYKALTDRLSIAHVEGPTIVISALLFAAINVGAFMPLNITIFPVYFLSFLTFGLFTAYLYNQTSTLVIPELALICATVIFNLFICMIH